MGLEALTGLQEGPKKALPDGTRYEYDPILKRTVEVTPSGERFPVTLVDGKLQRASVVLTGPVEHAGCRQLAALAGARQRSLMRQMGYRQMVPFIRSILARPATGEDARGDGEALSLNHGDDSHSSRPTRSSRLGPCL